MTERNGGSSNCRHEDLVQLLEVDFVTLLNSLTKSSEPVKEVMAWADSCCDRLMVSSRNGGGNVGGIGEDRSTMSPRSVLIRWGYVTSQIMRDLVSVSVIFSSTVVLIYCARQSAATRRLVLSKS